MIHMLLIQLIQGINYELVPRLKEEISDKLYLKTEKTQLQVLQD